MSDGAPDLALDRVKLAVSDDRSVFWCSSTRRTALLAALLAGEDK